MRERTTREPERGPDAASGRGGLDLGRDGLAAALLVALALALYRVTSREVLIGDGPDIVSQYVGHGWRAIWLHLLYMPVANLLRVVTFTEPLESLRLLSAVAGASAAASTFLLARCLGLGRPAAGWAAATVALTPAVWFQSTVIEVHAFQLATVTAAALLTVVLPWGRPALATAGAAAALGACYLAHMSSPLLGPGWVLLCQVGRARVGRPFAPLALALRVGLPLLLALLLAMAGSDWIRAAAGSAMRMRGVVAFLQEHRRPDGLPILELGRMLGLLPAIAVAALLARAAAGWRAWALGALAVPHLAWALWFGHHEQGGYLVVPVPFLALLAAHAWARGRFVALVLIASTAASAWLGYTEVVRSAPPVDASARAARAELVRAALPAGGVLLSFDATRQTVTAAVPNVREVNLQSELRSALTQGRTPEEFADRILPGLREVVAENAGRIALDATYRAELGAAPALAPYLVELDRRLEPFLGHSLERGAWRVVLLTLPGEEAKQ